MHIDYHVHPDFSIDACPNSIDDYCRQAVSIGLAEICFTPHFEADPLRRRVDWYVRLGGLRHPMDDWSWLDAYFRQIEDARRRYGSRLTVLAGVEIGYDYGLEEIINRLIQTYPFDFVLGAVHCLEHVAISSSEEAGKFFSRHSPQAAAAAYFQRLMEAVRTGFFDAVAHVDIYKRHGRRYYGGLVDLMHREWAEELFREAARRRMAVEINTSPWRAGEEHCHPSLDLLASAREQGVAYCTLGSDAHKLDDLGFGIDRAKDLTGAWKISIATFKGRQVRVLDKPSPES